MLQQIQLQDVGAGKTLRVFPNKMASNSISSDQTSTFKRNDVSKFLNSYKSYNNIKLASSISFLGDEALANVLQDMRGSVITCRDEKVGELTRITPLANAVWSRLPVKYDAIKTSDFDNPHYNEKKEKLSTETRIQLKQLSEKGKSPKVQFELVKRWERPEDSRYDQTIPPQQDIMVTIEPHHYDYKQMKYVGTPEPVYILKTKGNNVVVFEDGDNVFLTDTGHISKKDEKAPVLEIDATKFEKKLNGEIRENKFREIPQVAPVESVSYEQGESIGHGGELIIGLQEGRFVPEIIDSIIEFEHKVDRGEIKLNRFRAAEGAENMQIAMLAGGFGSRAEYANASSSRIMHGEENGSNLTKGCFRTATGLTPMETSFISLHNAGLLDCSKGHFKIGDNVKFYLNDSGRNDGNGSFTVDLHNCTPNKKRKNTLILPNDAMSRMPNALKELTSKINSGKAAMVMIAKKVKEDDAINTFGIMKIDSEGKIEEFAEKPNKIAEGYADSDHMVFVNTFQFSVSEEAFQVLNDLEPYIAKFDGKKKEARDWSKTYTPILMAITRNDMVNIQAMREEIIATTGIIIPATVLQSAKLRLGDQKIYAIPTDESWADCGTLNALYHTTCEIARGEFKLEPWERQNVLNSINLKTGLVASNKAQKNLVENRYHIEGEVMVVPKAQVVDEETVMSTVERSIVRYSDIHKS